MQNSSPIHSLRVFLCVPTCRNFRWLYPCHCPAPGSCPVLPMPTPGCSPACAAPLPVPHPWLFPCLCCTLGCSPACAPPLAVPLPVPHPWLLSCLSPTPACSPHWILPLPVPRVLPCSFTAPLLAPSLCPTPSCSPAPSLLRTHSSLKRPFHSVPPHGLRSRTMWIFSLLNMEKRPEPPAEETHNPQYPSLVPLQGVARATAILARRVQCAAGCAQNFSSRRSGARTERCERAGAAPNRTRPTLYEACNLSNRLGNVFQG